MDKGDNSRDDLANEREQYLERLIREAGRDTSPPPEFRRSLKLILLSKLGPRPRRSRLGFAALGLAAVCILMLVSIRGSDLGSDDFSLKETGTMSDGMPIYQTRSSEHSAGGTGHSVEMWESVLQHEAAGEETLLHIEGWTVEGKTMWSGEFGFEQDGQLVTSQREIPGLQNEISRKHLEFFVCCEETAREMIETGRAEYLGSKRIQFAGRVFRVATHHLEIPEWGSIIFHKGEPVTLHSRSETDSDPDPGHE